MKLMVTRFLLAGCVVLALSNPSGPLYAQEENPPKDSQESEKYRTHLEPVIVTARRYKEDQQKIPLSMVVIDGKDIEAHGLKKLSDIGDLTPNMGFDSTAPLSGSSNAASVFIRGIGQTDFIPTTDPGVGIYVDGVYLARSLGSVPDLLDIERIEVLRGPQGTLFGKNTIGGAVHLITRKPDKQFKGMLEASAESYAGLNVKAGADIPLFKDTLLSKVTLLRRIADGYGERVIDGEDMGDANSEALRGSILWMPSTELEVTLTFDWARTREKSPVASLAAKDAAAFDQGVNTSMLSSLYNMLVAPTLNVPGFGTGVLYDSRWLTGDPYKSNATGPNYSDLNLWGVALTAEWDASPIEIASITSFRTVTNGMGRDADHSPLTIAHTENEIEQRQWSQEVRVHGQAFEDSLDWLAGVYYFSEEAQDTVNIQGTPDLYSVIGLDIHIVGATESENSSSAAFAHATYHLTQQLDAFAGGRYTHERKRFGSEMHLSRTGVYLIDPGWNTESFNNVSPRGGLGYQWSDDVYSYASVSQGFKSGGFVARYVARRPEGAATFDPEKVTTYELGTKSEWFGKSLRANGAIFFSNYSDIQVIVFEGAAPITKNAARGEVAGAELDLTAVPAAGWKIGTGLGYLDAQYTGVEANSGITRGDHFVNTPEWSVAAWSEYRFPVKDWGELALFGNYRWRSEVTNDAADTPELRQDAVGLADARVTFAPSGKNVKVSVFVKNLTDERVITSGAADIPSFGIAEAVYGPPRVWGLSGEISF